MDLWLIEKGEKTGPFHDFEIRERIERGELARSDKAWHEGQDEWVELGDLELFRASFEEEPEPEPVQPPPLPNKPRPFVRFWARWFDFHLYAVLVFGTMSLLQLDIRRALESPGFMLTWLLPWLMLEAISVHLWRTTPGKRLLAVEVQKPGGEHLALGASLVRAIRVYILGLGMMLWIFPAIAQGFGLWYTLRFGEAPWDRLAGTEARVGRQTGPKIVLFILTFLALTIIWGAIMGPASEEMLEDILRQIREKYPWLYEKG